MIFYAVICTFSFKIRQKTYGIFVIFHIREEIFKSKISSIYDHRAKFEVEPCDLILSEHLEYPIQQDIDQ